MQVLNLQECVPRTWGSRGGGLTMSARCAKALIGRTPLGASLVPFCASRKELAHQGETMTQERR